MKIWDFVYLSSVILSIVAIVSGVVSLVPWQLSIAIIISIIILVSLSRIRRVQVYARKNRKRTIGIFLIIVASSFFIVAFGAVSTPSVEWSKWQNATSYPTPQGYPAVDFNIAIIFTASGSLSVNNPIHVHAYIFNVNITDLTKYYASIAFTGAYPVGVKPNSYNILETGAIAIKQDSTTGNGTYTADGTLNWLVSGASYLILVPQSNTNYVLQNAGGFEKHLNTSSIVIEPVSDTLSTFFNDNALRLTYVLIGFSVLMLQPVLEAILVPETSTTIPKKSA